MKTYLSSTLLGLFVILTAQPLTAQAMRPTATVKPVLLRQIPHDTTAFTQGFICIDSTLYESTGLHGRSSLRRIDARTGKILSNIAVPDVFAEGIAVKGGELVQLTWQEGIAIRYYFPSLKPRGIFKYKGEGWGLTTDNSSFIMSNGSDSIYFRNERFEIQRAIRVTLDGRPLAHINEMDYTSGKIYANVWYKDFVAEISPANGVVSRIIDCSEILKLEKPGSPEHVFNGIAYCRNKDEWYMTGKNWKTIYIVRFPSP